MRNLNFLLTLVLGVCGTSLTVTAAPWDLDPAFGAGGKVVWSPNGNTESRFGSGMALQADGKIVMVGGSSEIAGASIFMVVRFNADGSIDATFGNNGSTTVTFGGTSESGASVAIQPDGKIVVGGRTTLPGGGPDAAIARLNSNGTLDTTFSEDGKVTVVFSDFQGSWPSYLDVIKVAGDGKIVFAGTAGPGSALLYKTTIGRLNSDGSLDTTFSSDGRVINGLGSGGWRDLVVNGDGTIALTGTASAQFSSTVTVAKYTNTGSIEWEYFRNVQPGCYMSLNGIAAQPDGKYVVVGSNQCKAVAIRINADGTEDNTFDSTPYTSSSQAFAVTVLPDGKILATLGFDAHNDDGFSLIRYNSDGTVDSGFGNGGIQRITVLNGRGTGRDIVIQPDGKILVGGSTSVTHTSGYRFVMVRYRGSSVVPQQAFFDYDGDGKSDVSVFRPSENRWYVFRSSDFDVTQQVFAIAGDIPVPADYDGDDRTDFAIYRPSNGAWWYLSSIDGAQITVQWGGESGDVPRPSDFDGDGKADFVFFRPTNSFWYRITGNGTVSNVQFGSAGDKPVIGDFDGDGKSDPAIYRPSTGDWWYLSSISGAQLAVHWGISTDIPAPADYDGDGTSDLAVYRPSTGVWYVLNSSNGQSTILNFGLAEDKPVPADYDGDGKADIAVFRPSSGVWYLLRSTSGFGAVQFGVAGDIPTEHAFIP